MTPQPGSPTPGRLPPRGAQQESSFPTAQPPTDQPPPRRVNWRRSARAGGALLLIPVTLGTLMALATGVESNPDNLPLLGLLLLAGWVALSALHFFISAHLDPEDEP